ncbi:phosphoribosylamine--glycine ligase [Acetobacterium sp.]|uniref:phosphoribosylamine--glycine ligase n=1 Tax=Acetobacterium sp. TaxID=1872094 RepID=UPI0027283AAD|nr:phosphoribosylamine--glycine ligase [Acetobacterium sp.]MDO9492285.1 phosphoribosylamine--glycine ligase [Acetobacterium sp.]
MKILMIGSGGREHVLTWKLAQSPRVEKIYAAPGNGGMAELAECVDLAVEDIPGCLAFAKEHQIDLTVVGPEVPLVMGMVDAFEAEGLKVFGPNKHCAQFEGSKAFTKEFLFRHNIPTAAYKEYTDFDEIIKDLGIYGYPMVIKADGLAAGKGVLIPENEADALEGMAMIMKKREFGEAGDKVVIEEFLTGQEASMLCFVDGKTIVPMESAQDYKRAYDNDEGLNTGGMGTYSPNVLFADEALNKRIKAEILDPIIGGFIADGMNFKGILFIGLMIDNGVPKVLEFNVRFGDPEAQSVLMRMESDLVDIMEAVIAGELADCQIKWSNKEAVCVVIASGGYPGTYEKGKVITGIEDVNDCVVFHAGTKLVNGELQTNGGRVLCVTALGETREAARKTVYANIGKINFEGAQYRTDIAKFN